MYSENEPPQVENEPDNPQVSSPHLQQSESS